MGWRFRTGLTRQFGPRKAGHSIQGYRRMPSSKRCRKQFYNTTKRNDVCPTTNIPNARQLMNETRLREDGEQFPVQAKPFTIACATLANCC